MRRKGYSWCAVAVVLFVLLMGMGNAAAQTIRYADGRCMVLHCDGRMWNALALYIDAEEAEKQTVWIDRNGNGQYDGGIDVPPEDVRFGEWREYFFVSAALRIFGGVRELQCDYSDPMRLDVSGNPALERLNCEGNRLLELDLSNNGRLTHLNCNNNILYKLDVSGLASLKSLQCAGNQLRRVDLTKNRELEDLDVSYNYLSRLDLQQNGRLKRLDCVECGLKDLDVTGLPQLEFLDCSRNKIKELDLSRCGELRFLNCRTNKLRKLSLTAQANLQRLVCHSNEIEDLTVATPSQLVYVACQSNRLGYAETGYLAASLQTLPPQRPPMYDPLEERFPFATFHVEANDDGNHIASESVVMARQKQWKVITAQTRAGGGKGDVATPINEGVMRLYFTSDTVRFKLWLEADGGDKNRVWVDVNANGVFDENTDVDATTLKYGEWVEYEAVRREARVYGHAKALLVLAQGQLEAIDVSENPLLKKLGCSGNQLTALDVRHNPALEVLICSDNMLSMLNVSRNKKLRELHCNANQLTSLSVLSNRKLERLYCMGNQLKVLPLPKNKLLRHLDCSGNRIEALDISSLENLEQFGCAGNGLRRLRMRTMKHLYYVNVARNELPYAEMSGLVDALPKVESERPKDLDELTYSELYGVFRGYVAGDGNEFSTDLAEYIKAKRWRVE